MRRYFTHELEECAARNQICVDDINISDEHAQLRIMGDRVQRLDLGSSSGTLVWIGLSV